MSMKTIIRHPVVTKTLAMIGAAYLRLVWKLNRQAKGEQGESPLSVLRAAGPCIVVMWHGELFLAPFARPQEKRFVATVSNSGDGEIAAQMLARLGIRAIRGSGAANRKSRMQSGASALRKMLAAMRDGESLVIAAETDKQAFRCSESIIMLARLSGCPIYPASIHTSRAKLLGSWDRARLPLPFGRKASVLGEPIYVPREGTDEEFEAARLKVQAALEHASDQAANMVNP